MITAIKGIYIVLCIALVVIIGMQKSKDKHMGFLGAQTNPFWDKAKARTKDVRLHKATVLLTVLFFAATIAILILGGS